MENVTVGGKYYGWNEWLQEFKRWMMDGKYYRWGGQATLNII